MSEIKPANGESLQRSQTTQSDSIKVPRPRDQVASRIDNDRRIVDSQFFSDPRDKEQIRLQVENDIKREQVGLIQSRTENDPGVVAGANSSSTEKEAARLAAEQKYTKQVWGEFASKNPTLAEKFASSDPKIKTAIDSFIEEQVAQALREAKQRANQALNTDRDVVASEQYSDPRDKTQAREGAYNRQYNYALGEFVRSNPDVARLIAEAGINPDISSAYLDFLRQQEAAKNQVADNAAQVAAANGTDAAFKTIADGISKEDWEAEFRRANGENPTPKDDAQPDTSSAPIAEAKTYNKRSEAAKKAAWTRSFNKLNSSQPSTESARIDSTAPETTRPAERTDLPVEDRLSEAASDKVAAQRALQEARRRGAPEDVIAALEKNVVDAESYYSQSVADRDQAIIESRFAGIESTLQEILSRFDSSTPTPREASAPTSETTTTERPSNTSKEALLSLQIAQLQTEIASLKDTVKKTGQYLNESDPTKKRTLLAELIALTGAVTAEAVGSAAEMTTSQRPN